MASHSTAPTGTRDSTYDLVSALYHLLQGAQNCDQYARDAMERNAPELVQFFMDWKVEQVNLAERAKNLLAQQLGAEESGARASPDGGSDSKKVMKKVVIDAKAANARGLARKGESCGPTAQTVKSGGNDADDSVDEQAKETFPASDAPAHY